MDALLLIAAALVGALASWQGLRWYYRQRLMGDKRDLTAESQVLLERIEKVFKVVLAEGFFSEIYDHNAKRAFWGLFKTHSKALVVARAKVAIGYDFSKMRFRRDFSSRTLIVEYFAEPEIIATDTDYQFYDINQGLLNKFDNDDYTAILAEAKKLMQDKAMDSELPQIAQQQLHLMMQQLCATLGWQLETTAPPTLSQTNQITTAHASLPTSHNN